MPDANDAGVTSKVLNKVKGEIKKQLKTVFKNSQATAAPGCCTKIKIKPIVTTDPYPVGRTYDPNDQDFQYVNVQVTTVKNVSICREPMTNPDGTFVLNPDGTVRMTEPHACTDTQGTSRVSGGWEFLGLPIYRGTWSSQPAFEQPPVGVEILVYAHEVGHLFGLLHADGATDSIMRVGAPFSGSEYFAEALIAKLEAGPDLDGDGVADDVECSTCSSSRLSRAATCPINPTTTTTSSTTTTTSSSTTTTVPGGGGGGGSGPPIPELSPDLRGTWNGRWISYVSNEQGDLKIALTNWNGASFSGTATVEGSRYVTGGDVGVPGTVANEFEGVLETERQTAFVHYFGGVFGDAMGGEYVVIDLEFVDTDGYLIPLDFGHWTLSR